MLFLTKSGIILRVNKLTLCENLNSEFDLGSSTNPSNHIATERMLPLFRAMVKFCSTNRLLILLPYNLAYRRRSYKGTGACIRLMYITSHCRKKIADMGSFN